MSDDNKKGRNTPRTTTENIEKKKRDKKIKQMDDMGSYLVLSGNMSLEDLGNVRKERERIDEEAARNDRPSKGRNTPRKFNNGGCVSGSSSRGMGAAMRGGKFVGVR